MSKYDTLLDDAIGLAADLQFVLNKLTKEAFHSKDAFSFNRFREISAIQNTVVDALDGLEFDFKNKENPAVLAKPLKTATKLKWWAIGLLDENKGLVKRVVTQYRTRTEAKLFARSGLQKHSMGKVIAYALIEGPYATLNEAQTAPLIFPEEV